jgi:hypothetical protein
MALPTTTRCEVADVNGDKGRVWAAGDVTGTTYTHASHYQAGVVAANILGQRREADYSAIPRCVFTTPSVFAVGVVPGTPAARDEAAEEAAGDGHGPAGDGHGPAGDGHGPAAGNGAKAGNGTDPQIPQIQSAAAGGEVFESRRMLRIARIPAETGTWPARPEGARGTEVTDTGLTDTGLTNIGLTDTGLVTVRASLGDTTRAHLGQDDLGCLELYADARSGVLAGAVAVGPDAASWMGEITLAIRAKISVEVLADVVHAFPTYGEALETALRELAGTGGSTIIADQQEKGTGPLSELDMETPEGDAIEQHQEVFADETVTAARREVPFDVNEADAAEQERAVGFDDDDYR